MRNDAPLNSSGVGDGADCLPEVRREWVKQREEEEGFKWSGQERPLSQKVTSLLEKETANAKTQSQEGV